MNIIKKYNHIHMIGIGGVSMSGIAAILQNFGIIVTGSDSTDSQTIQRLIKKGINIKIGDNLEELKKADIVVYTAAIKADNIEMQKAKELGINTVERSEFLGYLTKCYEDTIAVSGTHGKTTTTAMVSLCFLEASLDPTIQIGGDLINLQGNYKIGNSNIFIIEACEYVGSFLKFFPKSEIILNIDNDHLDYFKSFENIKKTFLSYVKLLPEDGILVLNGDDEACLEMKEFTNANIVTFGIKNKNVNFYGTNIKFNKEGFAIFDVYKNEKLYGTFELNIPGIQNVSNALACISLCDKYEIEIDNIKNAFKKFTGVDRRFEFIGTYKNTVRIYDDYGHHPTEIKATVNALQNKEYNKSWVIFQPHTYSRTKNLLHEFAEALSLFDNIIITDIYAAREKNTFNISSVDLVNEINKLGIEAKYISDFAEITKYVKNNVEDNDIVLTLGAGIANEIGPMILK